LCGVNHGFMPIVVKAVTQEEFVAWVKEHQKTAKNKLENDTVDINQAKAAIEKQAG
jgi:cytochrome c oxidase subunit 2